MRVNQRYVSLLAVVPPVADAFQDGLGVNGIEVDACDPNRALTASRY
jgi:hypothetical protein